MRTIVPTLPRRTTEEVRRWSKAAVSAAALETAGSIVRDVRLRGLVAVREYAERFGERAVGEPLLISRDGMRWAYETMEPGVRGALERAAKRIEDFAAAQRGAVTAVDVPVVGGRAGHTVEPVGSAGCYAPAGRHPLPSSVLMTGVTARVAGVGRVVIASPGAHPAALAAGHLAGADGLLAVGGAHAVAAMAYGFEGFDPVDVIVGPGNAYVTAAKQLVSGTVGIDMLAGPSELLILADDTAEAALVAADLLAQAEHDPDAVPMLLASSGALVDAVDHEIRRQLVGLPTREVAEAALANGFACVTASVEESVALASRVGPEHLEILTAAPEEVGHRVRNAGALFLGPRSGEVMGDYGVGPNHTLPTGGSARFRAGLSVMDFLRFRTWLRLDHAEASLIDDTAALARLEGLAAHAAAAERRREPVGGC